MTDIYDVWGQAKDNHRKYSATGSIEEDIRFFALGLAGEAGEVANFVKKRWRDGDSHLEDLRLECADVFAYNIMLAEALGMTPDDLLETVAYKQQVFIKKMQARTSVNNTPEIFDITNPKNKYQPCPACGATLLMSMSSRAGKSFIICGKCDHEGPHVTQKEPYHIVDKTAFDGWNVTSGSDTPKQS